MAKKIKEWDLRDPEQHVAFSQAVAKAFPVKGKLSMREIQKETGGTGQQLRTVLNRMIENGVLEFEGVTKSTRYFRPVPVNKKKAPPKPEKKGKKS